MAAGHRVLVQLFVFIQKTKDGSQFSEDFYQGTINGAHYSFLKCSSKDDAEAKMKALQALPRNFFIRPSMCIPYENDYFLAVEKFDAFLFPIDRNLSREMRIELASNVVEMAISLDDITLVHGNLSKKTMVILDGKIKSYALPHEIAFVKHQTQQIYEIVKEVLISPHMGSVDDEITDFLEVLQTAYSTADLKSCMLHPLFMSPVEKLNFHGSSMLVIASQYTHDSAKQLFNSKVCVFDLKWEDRKKTRDIHNKTQSKKLQITAWQTVINDKGSERMKYVLDYRKKRDGSYGNSPFSLQTFIRNDTHHSNDGDNSQGNAPKKQTKVKIMMIQKEFESLFPHYLLDMHGFMRETGLITQLTVPPIRKLTLIQLCAQLKKTKLHQQVDFDALFQTIRIMDFILAKMSVYCLDGDIGVLRKDISKEVQQLNNIHEVNDTCSFALTSLKRYIRGIFFFIHGIIVGGFLAEVSLGPCIKNFSCWDGKKTDILNKMKDVKTQTVQRVLEFNYLLETEMNKVKLDMNTIFLTFTKFDKPPPPPQPPAWVGPLPPRMNAVSLPPSSQEVPSLSQEEKKKKKKKTKNKDFDITG